MKTVSVDLSYDEITALILSLSNEMVRYSNREVIDKCVRRMFELNELQEDCQKE